MSAAIDAPDFFARGLEAARLLHMGPGAHLRLESLRRHLIARGIGPDDVRIPMWLAAALCRSSHERQAFLTLFAGMQAGAAAPPAREHPGEADEATDTATVPLAPDRPVLWWRRRWVILASGTFLLIAIVVVLVHFAPDPGQSSPDGGNDSGGVANVQQADKGGSTNQISPPGTSPLPNWPAIVPLVVLLLIAAAYSVSEILRRRQLLRDHAPAPQRALALRLAENPNGLMTGRAWRLALRRLRRHRRERGYRLDLRATVKATIGAGGSPRLRFRSRALSPEYLLLSERDSPRDHLAWHARLLARRMDAEQIALSHFEFVGDPRRLRPAAGRGARETVPLAGALALNARANPLILAESFDSLAPDVGTNWVDTLRQASVPALLDPRPPGLWNAAERRARDAGIPPFAFDADGLGTYAAYLENPASSTASVVPDGFDLPESLIRGSGMLLRDEAPPAFVVDGLIDDLDCWLGAAGLDWLRALALFPHVEPELTVHMGSSLVDEAGAPLLAEARLLRLSRLPWFRTGHMPDWLRLALVQGLSPDQLARATEAIQAFLLPQQAGAVRIDLAAGADLRHRAKLREWLRLSPQSVLADRILVDALTGRVPDRLGVEIAPTLRDAVAPLWRNRIARAWITTLVVLTAMPMLPFYPALFTSRSVPPQDLPSAVEEPLAGNETASQVQDETPPAPPVMENASGNSAGTSDTTKLPDTKKATGVRIDRRKTTTKVDEGTGQAYAGVNEPGPEVQQQIGATSPQSSIEGRSGDDAIMRNDRAQSEILRMTIREKSNIDAGLKTIFLARFDSDGNGQIDSDEARSISCATLSAVARVISKAAAVTDVETLYFAPTPVGDIGFDDSGRKAISGKLADCTAGQTEAL
ncbi:hypothetical protein J3E64_000692 [Sphingobium sp. OAS761]|uniref:hypothetical protein n=1 Tax=Sphingobium sp. OAS761 TaxID=2817901 RepID=UPI00209DF6B2|nr:hypothetical protein [Sphingobium sp. OAS761]MCP1469021.1 hypothetical protein [Sphingobium sp. OAS761]